ncbi:hypothetical protein NITMOv2_1674 [Nitrospira moscoviensis]|uniref:Uncharacterized protein n=1 Tax=Nitrospira moscoviensis TaxID=42253 RepID=A0A0K2GAV1_NITMO|nr:hypothetical protein NITMOv2_1674 [Nitrospira moscoviensis]
MANREPQDLYDALTGGYPKLAWPSPLGDEESSWSLRQAIADRFGVRIGTWSREALG